MEKHNAKVMHYYQLLLATNVHVHTHTRTFANLVSVYFLCRCNRGPVQPYSICQPTGAAVEAVGSSDTGGWRGGNAIGGHLSLCYVSIFMTKSLTATLIVGIYLQDDLDSCAERKNDQKPVPVENGLNPASGPPGPTPSAVTPKASATTQHTTSAGSFLLQTQKRVVWVFEALMQIPFIPI